MASRIVVMKGGYIQQIGTPKEIYNDPANMFVASFVGAPATNFIRGVYKDGRFSCEGLDVKVPEMYRDGLKAYEGKEVVFGVRPEDIHIEGIVKETYPDAQFEFNVEVAELLGHEYILHGSIGNQKVLAKVSSRVDSGSVEKVDLAIDMTKIHFFDVNTENKII